MDSTALATVGMGASTLLAGALLYLWLMRPTKKFGPTPLLSFMGGDQMNSAALPDGSRCWPFGDSSDTIAFWFDDAKTLHDGFLRGLRQSNNGPCLGTRQGGDGPYVWLTYQQVYDSGRAVGSAVRARLGLERGQFVCVYAQNRAEWVIAETGCNQFSLVLVPLYDTLGTEACAHILGQTGAAVVFTDTEAKARSLLRCCSDTGATGLRHLVLMGPPEASEGLRAECGAAGVELHDWAALLAWGEQHLMQVEPPDPDDLATLCYTSGTTGVPKGVRLTHKNIMSNMAGVYSVTSLDKDNVSKAIVPLSPEDVYLSYLPLAHMFERFALALCFMMGMRVGFFRGDVRHLLDDMQALRPTMFCTVPRLLNRIYDRVLAGVSGSFIKSRLLQLAVSSKIRMLERGVIRRDTIWDRVIFSKVHQLTGGRVRLVITGSAPISPKVMQFVRAAFGCPVFEGYGQTETTAAVTVTLPGETGLGHVGAPLPCNHVRLFDVPEMGLTAAQGRGEVCVRGPNVFGGYYGMPDKTAEVLEPEGWLHTGDIGEWTETGCLKIVDRRKNIFKLSQGEYVAPEKIEQLLGRSPFVAQIFVDGDPLEVYVLAVVVPDPEYVLPWAEQQGLPSDLVELCRDPDGRLKRAVLRDLERLSRENGLKGFEFCKDALLWPDQFTVENGLLTPTFKSRRPELRAKFRGDFQRMYAGLRT